ncbi:hypothetical protein BDW02DRAFT_99260 [Decorospora gaudefroyi]|uniref:Uncharacterized protein n=1 Tax=Decorospora gaudefroyi TaxID=184978 RepID=A0A6A5JZR9_9PLEO|nr:hypothetical protein BDW02DRAFT_99260 [Decorospora gaudefroyi]
MSSKDNLALDLEHGVRRWDRARWISVFSSHNPTIREVTECLGLGLSASSSTTNRGIPKFDNPDYRKLSSEVTKLSKELPKERDALLDFAADPHSLDQELDELLANYGPAIWGRDADRTCLLSPDPNKRTYTKDLFYEEPEHKEILMIHLHRWIIIKACYYIRNMKLKRPSGANEYDQLADIDGEGASPHGTRRGTPQSLTPPEIDITTSADLEVKPVNLKKRKSQAHLTMSDDDDIDSTPVKRPYSTMPVSRKGSPRKSLKSLYPASSGSVENAPPMPTHALHYSSAPGNASEATRIQLSPLSNNELNGASRPGPTQNSAPTGFTAVNTGGFTAVNNTPPVKEPPQELVRDGTRESSKEVQRASPAHGHRHSNSYTSPYESGSHTSTISRPATDPPRPAAPPPTTAPAPNQSFHAVTSSAVPNGANGVTKKESPAVQHVQHTHIAPQPQPQPQVSQQVIGPPPQPAQQHIRSHSGPHTHLPSHPHIQAQQQPPHHRPPSRTNTPSHHFGRSIAPHPRSRSNTPHAQAATNQPTSSSNTQATAPPAIQSAAAYGIQLIPTQDGAPHTVPSSHRPSSHPAPTTTHHAQPVPKPHADTTQAHTATDRPTINATELRLLQCEVTAGLFTYFFPRTNTNTAPEETSLLQRLHTLWYHGEPLFRTQLPTHYDLVTKTLTAWLHERHAIAALRLSMQAGAGVSHVGLVDRLLAMNDLRAMRLKWKNMSSVDGLSPEDLLCMAFRVATNTEGSEYLFKDGLARLEVGVFEFLRTEDAKIVMARR